MLQCTASLVSFCAWSEIGPFQWVHRVPVDHFRLRHGFFGVRLWTDDHRLPVPLLSMLPSMLSPPALHSVVIDEVLGVRLAHDDDRSLGDSGVVLETPPSLALPHRLLPTPATPQKHMVVHELVTRFATTPFLSLLLPAKPVFAFHSLFFLDTRKLLLLALHSLSRPASNSIWQKNRP